MVSTFYLTLGSRSSRYRKTLNSRCHLVYSILSWLKTTLTNTDRTLICTNLIYHKFSPLSRCELFLICSFCFIHFCNLDRLQWIDLNSLFFRWCFLLSSLKFIFVRWAWISSFHIEFLYYVRFCIVLYFINLNYDWLFFLILLLVHHSILTRLRHESRLVLNRVYNSWVGIG